MGLFSKKPTGPVIKKSVFEIHWDTEDPFTFASHHEDDYPHGNRQLAPPWEEIGGRDLGRDYDKKLGFRMYNGKVVPGFPMHAHWGYETLTYPRIGYVDHFDHKGTHGRFGFGDAQWAMASSRYSHCEMYPLVDKEGRNPNDITQIMINIPLERKNGENAVTTIWSEDIPVVRGDGWEATILCGTFGGESAESPSPGTWALRENGVRIVRFQLEPGAVLRVDPAMEGANRNVYMTSGDGADLMGTPIMHNDRAKVEGGVEMTIANGETPAVIWLLEGRPIGQKMASFGPVILGNTKEVRAALDEIRKSEYAEWPFDVVDKVHLEDGTGRFISYPDGREERPHNRNIPIRGFGDHGNPFRQGHRGEHDDRLHRHQRLPREGPHPQRLRPAHR